MGSCFSGSAHEMALASGGSSCYALDQECSPRSLLHVDGLSCFVGSWQRGEGIKRASRLQEAQLWRNGKATGPEGHPSAPELLDSAVGKDLTKMQSL